MVSLQMADDTGVDGDKPVWEDLFLGSLRKGNSMRAQLATAEKVRILGFIRPPE